MSRMMMVWSTKAFAVGFLEQPKDLPSEESDVRTLNDFYSPAKSNFLIAIQGTQGNDTFQIRTVLKDWHRKQKQEFCRLDRWSKVSYTGFQAATTTLWMQKMAPLTLYVEKYLKNLNL